MDEDKVEFLEEDELITGKKIVRQEKITAIANLFIKIGLAKDEKSANTVMIIITILAFAMTIFLMVNFVL